MIAEVDSALSAPDAYSDGVQAMTLSQLRSDIEALRRREGCGSEFALLVHCADEIARLTQRNNGLQETLDKVCKDRIRQGDEIDRLKFAQINHDDQVQHSAKLCEARDRLIAERNTLQAENERLKAELSVEPTRNQMARATISVAADRESLQKRVAELERDAKRYRWMREFTVGFLECPDGLPMWNGPGDELDSAIDAALEANP